MKLEAFNELLFLRNLVAVCKAAENGFFVIKPCPISDYFKNHLCASIAADMDYETAEIYGEVEESDQGHRITGTVAIKLEGEDERYTYPFELVAVALY